MAGRNRPAKSPPGPQPLPGFRSLRQETAIALLRGADRVRQRFTAVLKPEGLSLQQYNVLRILRGAGEPGLPALQVAHRLIERHPGITRLIDGLERRGLLRRERCPVDRRVIHNRITPAGLELLARLDEPIDHADDDVLSMLDDAELARLAKLLRKTLSARTGGADSVDDAT